MEYRIRGTGAFDYKALLRSQVTLELTHIVFVSGKSMGDTDLHLGIATRISKGFLVDDLFCE